MLDKIRTVHATPYKFVVVTFFAVSLIIAVCFPVITISCNSSERRISLFLYTDTDPYIMLYTEEILANAGTDLRVERHYARNSQTIQNEQIERAIHRKSDLMIVNPVDRLGMYPIIERLRQEKIPVIFINREPLARDLDRWNQTWYVGARAEQSGQLQASLVATLFGPPSRLGLLDRNGDGRIQTVLLKGEQGHQDAEIRTQQVTKSLASASYDIDLLATEVANWNEEQALHKMEGVITRWLPQIELIISNNDAMALGAIKALRATGKFVDDSGDGIIGQADKSWIPVVGIDGIRDAQEMIDRGYLAGTVYNDYRSQAQALMCLARSVLKLSSQNIPDSKYVWIDYTTTRPD